MKRLMSILALCFAILGAVPALAINFDATIKNLDGTPLIDDKGNPVLTVRVACINALLAPLSTADQAKPDSGKLKQDRTELAHYVYDAPQESSQDSASLIEQKKRENAHVFTSDDIVLMKRLVNEQYTSPLVVDQVWKELERK